MNRNVTIPAVALGGLLLAGGGFFLWTQRDTCQVGARTAPPPAFSAAPTPASAQFTVAPEGTASFLIDAPLEKIKGRSRKLRGTLDVDVAALAKSRGQIDLDLDDLATETFDDTDKNTSQTHHAHNWLGLGPDVPAKEREENRWARFTIRRIDSTSPTALADAPAQRGVRTVKIVASGDLWLHGVTSPKTVKLTVTFSGPPDAPTTLHVVTDEPIDVSLKEHDVKPRDVAGKFLSGALEKVGKKIDDRVQVRLDLTARRGTRA